MNGFDAYQRHVNPVLAQLEKIAGMDGRFVRAEGCRMWDDRGNEYLDFIAGHGAFNLGHNHPEIIKCIKENLSENLPQIYGTGASPHMGELAAKLTDLAGDPFEIAFFANSGTEAVEGALKIARAATGRPVAVYCHNAYHGATMGSLSMIGKGPLRDPFEPLLPGFVSVPFNDLEALEEALKTHECAAFVTEPIQAEGGVNTPMPGYLKRAGELCRKHGALFILDEVQTGLGRTGALFAFQDEDVVPDILVLAKSLGGGILPIGAYATSRDIFDRAYGTYETCISHHSTFGGNSICCQAAGRALELLASDDFLKAARKNGSRFIQALRDRFGENPLIAGIRGRGLLIGIEFAESDHPWLSWENLGLPEFAGHNALPSLAMKRLFKNRIVTQICGLNWNVLKAEPPLTIRPGELDRFVKELSETVDWIASIA